MIGLKLEVTTYTLGNLLDGYYKEMVYEIGKHKHKKQPDYDNNNPRA